MRDILDGKICEMEAIIGADKFARVYFGPKDDDELNARAQGILEEADGMEPESAFFAALTCLVRERLELIDLMPVGGTLVLRAVVSEEAGQAYCQSLGDLWNFFDQKIDSLPRLTISQFEGALTPDHDSAESLIANCQNVLARLRADQKQAIEADFIDRGLEPLPARIFGIYLSGQLNWIEIGKINQIPQGSVGSTISRVKELFEESSNLAMLELIPRGGTLVHRDFLTVSYGRSLDDWWGTIEKLSLEKVFSITHALVEKGMNDFSDQEGISLLEKKRGVLAQFQTDQARAIASALAGKGFSQEIAGLIGSYVSGQGGWSVVGENFGGQLSLIKSRANGVKRELKKFCLDH